MVPRHVRRICLAVPVLAQLVVLSVAKPPPTSSDRVDGLWARLGGHRRTVKIGLMIGAKINHAHESIEIPAHTASG